MKKILSLFCIITVLFSNFAILANEEEIEEIEEIDYIWLGDIVKEAKEGFVPDILSKSAIIYERNSKQILFGKNEHQRVPMASTTKIMTAIVLEEELAKKNIPFDTEVIVENESAIIQGSRLGLKKGDKITYNDLLYGLMLCSRK